MSGDIISAAADGVGALKSATKSEIVKSVSWQIAEIIGILLLNISLATFSSLNGHKSSIDPPPLASTITSISNLFKEDIDSVIDFAASSP